MPAYSIEIIGGFHQFADRKNLILAFERIVLRQRGRAKNLRSDLQIAAHFPDGMFQIVGKIWLGVQQYVPVQLKDFLKAGGFLIGQLYHTQIFGHRFFAAADLDFLDLFILAGSVQRYGQVRGRPVDEDTIPVDPASVDLVDVIVQNVCVHRIQQLPVSDIGQKIRLHNT